MKKDSDSNYVGHFDVWWTDNFERPMVQVDGGLGGTFEIKDEVLANELWSKLRGAWLANDPSSATRPDGGR